jgi:hypothetical protein
MRTQALIGCRILVHPFVFVTSWSIRACLCGFTKTSALLSAGPACLWQRRSQSLCCMKPWQCCNSMSTSATWGQCQLSQAS